MFNKNRNNNKKTKNAKNYSSGASNFNIKNENIKKTKENKKFNNNVKNNINNNNNNNKKKNNKKKSDNNKKRNNFNFIKIIYIIGFITAGAVIIFFVSNKINYYFFNKKIFKLKKIIIKGANISKQEKMKVLKLSGFYYGENLININLKRATRMIASDRWYKDITVYRKYPDKIFILLKKRKVGAILNDGKLYYLSRTGFVIGKVNDEAGYNYPVITGINGNITSKNVGYYLSGINKALHFLKIIDHSYLKGKLNEIHIQKDKGVVAYTNSGKEIKFGNGDIKNKLKTLKMLLYEIKKINIKYNQYINLEYKNEAVVGVNSGSRVLPANYKKIVIPPDIWK
ncbi:MAG: cell division protein FtsQ/DivIB [Deltaproteobacteria bacterium]|nr:cell division protein FtsQ/DivIB [Deltaproteobacteria bacterium]